MAAPQQDSTGALSSHYQHAGDQGSETFEREKEISIDEQLKGQLREIDAALERVDEGTYGRCEVGGEEIDEERLGLLPATRYCASTVMKQKSSCANTESAWTPP